MNHAFVKSTRGCVKKEALKHQELLFSGRRFLVLLHKVECKIRLSKSSYVPSNLTKQLRNWQHVLALMLRKFSAAFDDSADYDFEIENPIFVLSEPKGDTNE